MKNTTVIRTMDEKAAFIAENMTLTFYCALDDLDIEWYYIIKCTYYAVEDEINGEIIFADYDEACEMYNDICDNLEETSDMAKGAEVTISEVGISYADFITSSELDIGTLSDLFDNLKTTKKKILV